MLKRHLRRESAALWGLLLTWTLAISPSVLAQNIVVNPGNGSYASLKAAFDAINAGTHTGAITIDVVGNTNEAFTATLNASGSGGANYTSILMRPSGGATRTIASSIATSGQALINLNGADGVTIDGQNAPGDALVLDDPRNDGLATIRLINGASNNTIRNSTILGSGIDGSNILFANDSVSGNGNDNNIVEANTIAASSGGTPRYGIHCAGSTNTANAGNQLNLIINNKIADAFSATLNSAAIVTTNGCNRWTISNNRIYQTAARSFTATATWRGIELNSNVANTGAFGFTVTGNVIGFANAEETGVMEFAGNQNKIIGIYLQGPVGGAASVIENNRITAIGQITEASGNANASIFIGIHARESSVTIRGNRLGSQSLNNAIQVSANTTLASDIAAIMVTTAANVSVIENSVGGIRFNHTAAVNANQIGLFGIVTNSSTSAVRHVVARNTIGSAIAQSLRLQSSSTSAVLAGLQTGDGEHVITGNLVQNLSADATVNNGRNTVVGLAVTSPSHTQWVDNNTISQLENTHANNNGRVAGLIAAGGNSTYSRNRINRLAMSSMNVSVNAEVVGLLMQTGGNLVRNNMVSLGEDAQGVSIANGTSLIGMRELSFNMRILHNSVLIHGNNVMGSGNTVALDSTQLSPTRFYLHNVFSNERSNGTGSGKHYAIRVLINNGLNNAFISNHNDLHVSGVGGVLGSSAFGLDHADLAQWRAATGQDLNSVSVNPSFVSRTDLHLPASSAVRGLAPVLSDVRDDLDQQLRPGLDGLNDLGADEVDGNEAASNDLAALDFVTPTASGFVLTNANLTPRARVINRGTNIALNAPIRFKISDASNAVVYDQVVSVPNLDPGAAITVVFPSTALNLAGGYQFSLQTELPGDANATNDSISSSLTVRSALAGIIHVGSGGDFASLTNAGGVFHAVNELGASAALEIRIVSDLSGETGSWRLPIIAGNHSVLIRPFGAPRTIRGSSSFALIHLDGTDNVTIDGSTSLATSANVLGGEASLRELRIVNEAPSFGAVILAASGGGNTGGAINLNLRNLVVEGNSATTTQYGIMIGASLLGGGARNDNTRIENCAIRRVAVGIFNVGSASPNASPNTVITRNVLGAIGDDRLGRIGIHAYNQSGLEISQNDIGNIENNLYADVVGIQLASTPLSITAVNAANINNASVRGNRIRGLINQSSQSTAGIYLSGNTGNQVNNNQISNLSANAVLDDRLVGMYAFIGDGNTMQLAHNSVNLLGDRGPVANLQPSFALMINGNNPLLELVNNILVNQTSSATTSAKTYAMGFSTTTFANLDANNNLYFTAGNNAALVKTGSLSGGIDQPDLAAWRAISGDDANALFGDPKFVSDSDLHLQTMPLPSPAISFASILAGINSDIDGDARGASERDIGADEVATPTFGQLSLTPAILDFGNVARGASAELMITFVASADGPVVVHTLSAATAPFAQIGGGTCGAAPFSIAANGQCTIRYRFTPIVIGLASQTLSITKLGNGSTNFDLTGIGLAAPASLSVTPSTVQFGAIVVGQSSGLQTVVIRNSGDLTMTVSNIDAIAAPFVRLAASTCNSVPFDLIGGAECNLVLQFAPTTRGAANQVIGVSAGTAGNASSVLSGSGLQGVLTVAPSSINFGVHALGSSSAVQLVTLSNTGDASLTLIGMNGLSAPFERASGGTCLDLGDIVIAANNSCTMGFRFVPLMVGSFQQAIALIHNGQGNPSFNVLGEAQSIDSVFRDGFENAPVSTAVALTTKSLSDQAFAEFFEDANETPTLIDALSDSHGEVMRIYLRKMGGQIELACAKRLRQGQWVQSPWQKL